MESYKVYLTKSGEAASRIAKSFGGEFSTGDIQSVSHGKVCDDNELVPAVYHGKGYFYCIVTLKEHGNDAPTYELTIC